MSFSDLKVLDGQEYETYKEVCLAMGLLEDDSEWFTSMAEVMESGTAHQIRAIFAVILQYGQPTKPKELFDTFSESMSDDFIYQEMKDKNCGRDDVDMEEVELTQMAQLYPIFLIYLCHHL